MTSDTAVAMGRAERFVGQLLDLTAREERAALAALRRALGKPPGEAGEAHRYIVPFVGGLHPRGEEVYYLVGSLFALHPMNWGGEGNARGRNLGASFAWLARESGGESTEKRFVALLNAHRDDLPEHLRHAISLLRSKDVPVAWAQLIRDIEWWGHESRRVQREWARAFWGAAHGDPAKPIDQTGDSSAGADADDERGNA